MYKALKTEFATVACGTEKRIEAGKGVDDELLSVIELISIILGSLKGRMRMENKKEMTIPNVSAATDAEQSLSKCTDNSIVNQDTDFRGTSNLLKKCKGNTQTIGAFLSENSINDNAV